MSFVIVNTATKTLIRNPRTYVEYFATERGAKISMASLKKMNGYADIDMVVMDRDAYVAQRPTKIVMNLMSGQYIEIPVDTPACCDPSTETYWSM